MERECIRACISAVSAPERRLIVVPLTPRPGTLSAGRVGLWVGKRYIAFRAISASSETFFLLLCSKLLSERSRLVRTSQDALNVVVRIMFSSHLIYHVHKYHRILNALDIAVICSHLVPLQFFLAFTVKCYQKIYRLKIYQNGGCFNLHEMFHPCSIEPFVPSPNFLAEPRKNERVL